MMKIEIKEVSAFSILLKNGKQSIFIKNGEWNGYAELEEVGTKQKIIVSLPSSHELFLKKVFNDSVIAEVTRCSPDIVSELIEVEDKNP